MGGVDEVLESDPEPDVAAAAVSSAYEPIENYGVVGDLRTAALIAKTGSVDFLCFPRFDSPTVFAALLDAERGGRLSLAPLFERAEQRQLYLPDSNILLTRFLTEDGIAEISDFMPVGDGRGRRPSLVRRVKTIRGEVRYRLVCAPRFDYARTPHRLVIDGREAHFEPDGGSQPALRLTAGVPLRTHGPDAVAEFALRASETATFVLDSPVGRGNPAAHDAYVPSRFKETLNYWRAWIGRSGYRGRWRETVNRSALALKLLIPEEFGAPIAAVTFGLPEWIGGVRNWDYRYTWIRDASLTMHALISLGFVDEPRAFLAWIEDRCREAEPTGMLRLMYRFDGGRVGEEVELPLAGYRGSVPVRVGNAAAAQTQLDIYGELVEAVYFYHRHRQTVSDALWTALARVIDWVCEHWDQQDEGIWEVRGGAQDFVYSRLMCWLAVDRALRMAADKGKQPSARWRRARADIARDIRRGFWDTKREAYVQHKGSTAMGAATLRMPLVGFIRPADPRWRSTLRAIEHDLVDDAFVYRYRSDQAPDGLPGNEGTLCLCSFWYVACLLQVGEIGRARLLFEKMLGYANHLGLYSEQLGRQGEHLGNFPQAFSHLGLVTAGITLDRAIERQRRGGAFPAR